MDTLLRKGLLVFFLTLIGCHCEKLICFSKNSKNILECQIIYTYFRGVTNGFFIDIFPPHPIKDSSTLYMDSLGWNGINILKDKDTYNMFRNTRPLNMNKHVYVIEQDYQTNLNVDPPRISMSQLCSMFIYKKPQFMAIPAIQFTEGQYSSCWMKQDYKPQFILVKQYGQFKLSRNTFAVIKEYGYSEIVFPQNSKLVVFIQNRLTDMFKGRRNINQPFIKQKGLIPFNNIMNQLGTHILKKQITNNQLNGNILANQIQISFAKYFSVMDNNKQSIANKTHSYQLMMQFNSHSTSLILPKQIKYKLLTLESGKYFHITYSPNNKQFHYYIYDHEFTNPGVNGNDFIFSLSQQGILQLAKFQGNQIKKYNSKYLAGQIILSILVTAVITACIMKRMKIIKNNAQMHNQQQITDVEQSKSQADEIQIKG